MFCSDIPVSRSRLTIFRTRMSLKEYSRWLPEPARAANRRHHQRRPRPMVELTVGDPGDLACRGNPVPDQIIGHNIVGKQSRHHIAQPTLPGVTGWGSVIDDSSGDPTAVESTTGESMTGHRRPGWSTAHHPDRTADRALQTPRNAQIGPRPWQLSGEVRRTGL